MKKNKFKLDGKRYTRLVVIKEVFVKNRNTYWECVCDCGTTDVIVRGTNLVYKNTESCGCLKKELDQQKVQKMINNNTVYSKREVEARSVWARYSDGDITFEKFCELSQLPCYYCDSIPFKKVTAYKGKEDSITKDMLEASYFVYNGLDRLDNTIKEHNVNNVVSCCFDCNILKCDQSFDEFVQWVKMVYERFENERKFSRTKI